MSKKKSPKKKYIRKPKVSNSNRKEKISRNRNSDLLPVFVLLIITVIVLSPSLFNGFVNWDDDANLLDNPYLQNFDWESIKGIFSSTVIGNYNPLPIFTFAIEKSIFGLNPAVFHISNLLLHLGCTILAYRILLKLHISPTAAFIGALLFGIHPMRVESVAWVTERKDVLFGIFYLTAILFYIRALKEKSHKKYNWIILILFVLSLFSKIQAVALPLSMLALDYYFRRPLKWQILIEKIPYFILSLIIGALGVYLLGRDGSLEDATNYSFFERLLIGAYSYCVYLYKLIVPYPLSPMYPYPKVLSWWFYVSVLPVIAIIGGWFWAFRKDWRKLVFGMAFFTFNVVFLLQILGAGHGFLADRFTYIPYLGLFFLAGAGYDYLNDNYSKKRKLIIIGITVYLLSFAMMSWQQCKVWKDGGTLWTHVLKYYPNAVNPWINLGHYYRDTGDFENALAQYTKAIEVKSDKAITYNSRGKLYFDHGHPNEAIRDLGTGIELDSTNDEMYINRGAAYGMIGNYELALQDFSQGIELNPKRKNAYLNRSMLYFETGKYDKAIADYDTFLELDPENAEIWFERGTAKYMLRQYSQAIQDLNQAIRLKPNTGKYYLQRSQAYRGLGQKDLAIQDATQAQQLGESVDAGFLRSLQ
ncbi:MAG: tetratricopeptide repeat protein [Bacteroidetes bacterium]|nr:tetratricopeptide repeat protein [Bacteroidota bacterium]